MTEPLVIVLQMGKVASSSWYRAIGDALPGREILHMHQVNPRTVKFIRDTIASTGEKQTITNAPMLRTRLRLSEEKAIAEAFDSKRPIQLVSGIRDPVDRSISVFFFLADFYGHKHRCLSHRENPKLDELITYFIDSWRAALAGEEGQGTFDSWLRSEFVGYREWFETEVTEFFGIDITKEAFNRSRLAMTAAADGVSLFAYRFEDLGRHDLLQRVTASANEFLVSKIRALPRVNATEDRRARELYQAFRERVCLSKDLVGEIYRAPVLSLFYATAELEIMKSRWSGQTVTS